MSYPYFFQVQRAHLELTSEGRIKHRWNEVEALEDMGLLTRRAAFYVYQDDDKTHGLLKRDPKGMETQSQGFSPDTIIDTEGNAWRIATIIGGIVQPIDGDMVSFKNEEFVKRWTLPSADLAGIDLEAIPAQEEDISDDEILAKIDQVIELIDHYRDISRSEHEDLLKSQQVNTEIIISHINLLVSKSEEALREFLVTYQSALEGSTPELKQGESQPSQLTLLLLKTLGPRSSDEDKKG